MEKEMDLLARHKWYHALYSALHNARMAGRKQEAGEVASPYHPAYGLADDTRKKILADAAETSVQEAAKKHNVAQSTVYRWRADMLAEG